jgi:hypothetical protein
MLHALWAATIPVLIHLLNRRRSVTVAFSNVALLQTLQQDRMRRVKVKQWILLALRTLLIVFLVLAFARPTIRQASFGSGHGETSAVMLLDRSLSMGHLVEGASQLDRAKQRAEEATKLFDAGDRLVLLPYDDRVDLSSYDDVDRVRLKVAGTESTFRGSNPISAVDAARRLLRESQSPNRELYIFSDLSAAGWSQVRDSYDGFEGTTVFVASPPGSVDVNVGIRSIRPAGLLLTLGEPAQLIAEVENYGASAVNELPVHVFVDDQRVGQRVIQLAAGERKRVSFRYTPDRGGARAFQVQIPEDDFAADNTRTSVVHIPDRLRVGVLGSERSLYYTLEALGSGTTGSLQVSVISPETSGSEAFNALDLIILCDAERLGRGEITAIRKRVSQGAGLLILMGEQLDVRLYNEQVLPSLCPATITGISGRRSDKARYAVFDGSGVDHPTLNGLVGSDLASPRFYLSYDVRPESGVRPLLSFSSGTPAILETEIGQGRVMLVTTYTDLNWSDLSITGFFAPFLHRTVRYLSTGAYGTDDVLVGERVARAVTSMGEREAVVQPPAGPVQTVWAQQLGSRAHWVIEEANLPGIWQVYAGERVVDRFAAQISPRESDRERIGDEALSALFPGADVVFVSPDDPFDEVVSGYRLGAELWRYFLFAALVCLAVELALMSGEIRERA